MKSALTGIMFRHAIKTITQCPALKGSQIRQKSTVLDSGLMLGGICTSFQYQTPQSLCPILAPCFLKSISPSAGREPKYTFNATFSTLASARSSTSHLVGRGLPINSPSVFHANLTRQFHAIGSKVKYLDFRHRFRTNRLKLHLLIIRRQKMKKHRKQKWRKKFKCLLEKRRLKREIGKEKAFRVELLTYIRRAEQFDPREYALAKIAEVNNRPRDKNREEKLEELKELIRINRYQTDYIKPKHRRPSFYTTQ